LVLTSPIGLQPTVQATKDNQLPPWCQIPRVHHRIYKSPTPTTILSQLDPLHTPQVNHPKIHSVPILPSTTRSSKLSFSFRLSHQNPVQFLSHVYHMPRPPHFPWFYSRHPHTINVRIGDDVWTVAVIRLRRVRWVGHVTCMWEMRNLYRILIRKLDEKRTHWWTRRRWEDTIKMGF
jgi:hypothetical protein